MADRSFSFLQGYPVKFQLIDTNAGPELDRDDAAVPLVNGKNVSIYRDTGADNIVRAMQDLTQNKFVDQLVSNKYAEAGLSGPIKNFHQSIFDETSRRIARTLLKNSQGGVSVTETLQNIYDAIVLQGLDRHFPIEPQPGLFNLNAKPPPGFATLNETKITSPPQVPQSIGFAENYDGFNAAHGIEYDSQEPPDVPDSNYGNEYPEKEQTGGSGSNISAPNSIVGECFDAFIQAVDQNVQLNHQGVSPGGTPISTSDVVIVTI